MRSFFILIFLLAGIFLPEQGMRGQIFSMVDDCNPLIRAIEPYLFVVRTEYSLEDEEGNLYGQNGNSYFGQAYGPAINVGGSLIVSARTMQPYREDTSYRAYGENYQPIVTAVFYKGLEDKKMEEISKGTDKVYYSVIDSFSDAGMGSAEEPKDSMPCVVVTFLRSGSASPGQALYRLSYVQNGVQWQGMRGTLANGGLGDNAQFALLFYEQLGPGRVSYLFGGFVEKESGAWVARKYDPEGEGPKLPAGLTPAGKKKKGKKQKH